MNRDRLRIFIFFLLTHQICICAGTKAPIDISTVPILIESPNQQVVPDEFIEKIYTIDLGLQFAYNAGFIEYEDGYLMAFRFDTLKMPVAQNLKDFHNHIGLVQLDANFTPIKKWNFCKILGNHAYDPRLIRVGSTIYILYTSSAPKDPHPWISSGICIAEVQKIADELCTGFPKPLRVPFQRTWEKNWVPFTYQNKLVLSYSINPHVTVIPNLQSGFCSPLSTANSSLIWDYGPIRGGTPAILVDGEYLAFFHSPTHEPNRGNHTYHVGAYTFLPDPPFTLTRISSHPFYHPDFYSVDSPVNPSHIIFPSGIVMKGNKILVSYGEKDACIKVMEIDKEKLFKSLISIQ